MFVATVFFSFQKNLAWKTWKELGSAQFSSFLAPFCALAAVATRVDGSFSARVACRKSVPNPVCLSPVLSKRGPFRLDPSCLDLSVLDLSAESRPI